MHIFRLIVALALWGAFWLSAQAQTNASCQQAQADFELAQNTAAASERLAILERSLGQCPTFAGWYLKGRTHLALNQAQAAIEALEQARLLADSSQYLGLALGRLGEAYLAQGDVAVARSAVDAAAGILAPPPDWLNALREQTDRRLADQTLDAATIARVLNAGKSFYAAGRKPPRIDLRVHFDFDSAELTPDGVHQVSELGRALADFVAHQSYRVRVIGHTDAQGSNDYNQTLSERRARRVTSALAQQFPALADALSAEGRGMNELLYPGTTEDVHRLNRRVEVELIR